MVPGRDVAPYECIRLSICLPQLAGPLIEFDASYRAVSICRGCRKRYGGRCSDLVCAELKYHRWQRVGGLERPPPVYDAQIGVLIPECRLAAFVQSIVAEILFEK